jgi:hypothetical protein
LHQSQNVFAKGLRIEVCIGHWTGSGWHCHLLQDWDTSLAEPVDFAGDHLCAVHLVDDGEDPIAMLAQEIRESVRACLRLDHLNGHITKLSGNGVDRNRLLAPVIAFLQRHLAQIMDVAQPQFSPASNGLIQTLHHPNDLTNSLIELGHLGCRTGHAKKKDPKQQTCGHSQTA